MIETEHPLYRHLRGIFFVDVVVPVSRASLGLMASLQAWCALGNVPVIGLCANVCHDVVAAVLGAGFRPIFLDLNPITGQVPVNEWYRARQEGASVALVVHLYGNPSDVLAVREIFPIDETLIIDDAAQAYGAHNTFGSVGAQGDIGLLSFGATKHISGGGAALLVRSGVFAEHVERHLNVVPVIERSQAERFRDRFRCNLQFARTKLRDTDGQDISAFNGLLDEYSQVLGEAFPEGSPDRVWRQIQEYDHARNERCHKAATWGQALCGSGLIPVGMGEGAVPWRYVCRLPGIDWINQHKLAESMRASGLNVSHWYLPAHWMCGGEIGDLIGVERLSKENFQFWIDETVSLESIWNGAEIVKEVLKVTRL